jgi:hypothetical protein
MMFKEKSSKKKIVTDNTETFTLDAMHNNMIKDFENSDKEREMYSIMLDGYEKESQDIMNEIEKSENDKEITNILWASNIELREKILDIKEKIFNLNTFDEIEYYKNTSDILFQYYETVDKQSNINTNITNQTNTIMTTSELLSKQPKVYKNESKKKRFSISANTINVLDALNNIESTNTREVAIEIPQDLSAISSNTIDERINIDEFASNASCIISSGSSITNIYNEEGSSSSTASTASVNTKIIQDKSSLVDKYMSIINKKYVRNVEDENIEMCKVCNNQMICLQQDAIMICNLCGYQELLLVEQNRPILKQNTKDTSHFCYKRINHFREWCNQVQGKESTDIPDEIFERILSEIKKEKILDLKKITYAKMRDILKRLRINKYYEHINYIINRINGIPTPQFSPELEDKLCNMFKSIQAPFLKHCPKDRKNFLSYSYVLYKFFQILGLHEYLKYFPLLKSREKLYIQDQIWKKICIELNYEIIPSL